MRALVTSMLLVAATGSASAHVLDADHAIAEQLGHQLASPHHPLFILLLTAGALLLYRHARRAGATRKNDT